MSEIISALIWILIASALLGFAIVGIVALSWRYRVPRIRERKP